MKMGKQAHFVVIDYLHCVRKNIRKEKNRKQNHQKWET